MIVNTIYEKIHPYHISLGFSFLASAQSPARDYINAVLWQQTSAENRTLCFQAYNFARLSLKESVRADTSKKPNCVIVDIDKGF